MKRIKPLFLISLLFVLICSCTTNYRIRNEAKIDVLNLCLRFDSIMPDSVKVAFEDQAAKFVTDFNLYEHAFMMKLGDDTTKNAIIMDFSNMKFAGFERQRLGVVVTTIGLTTFVYLAAVGSPFILWFCYIPLNVSDIEVKLSSDLTLSKKAISKKISNTALFSSKKRQVKLHKKQFRYFLRDEIELFEEQYIKR
jgi:hypothetical protein